MKSTVLKWTMPFAALCLGIVGAVTINALASDPEEKKQIDARPIVAVELTSAINHQVEINSYGEVKPFESTLLSVQVSGAVTYWNERFVTGGIVAKGALLMSVEKDNYEAAVLQAEAELSSAQAKLIDEQAQSNVAADEAKRFPNKKYSELFLRKPQLMSAKASVKSAQANLKRKQRDLKNCDIYAPYNALIISRDIGLGQYVNQGEKVAKLNNIKYAEVVVPVSGFDSAFLADRVSGQPAVITQTGLNGFTREAYIHRDLGVVDTDTRMANIVVRIADPYGLESQQPKLKFGSFVQVSFSGKTLNQLYKIPQDLVNNKTVWILNKDDQLEPRKVNVLREEGAFFYVSAGLNENERIVTTLPEYPQKGMAVKVAGSDSSKTTSVDTL